MHSLIIARYWANGAQIIPPHDTGAAQAIERNLQPWQEYDFDSVSSSGMVKDATKEVADAYFDRIKRLSTFNSENNKPGLKVTYTGTSVI